MWTNGQHSLLRKHDREVAEKNIINKLLIDNKQLRYQPRYLLFYQAGLFTYKINAPIYLKKHIFHLLKETHDIFHCHEIKAFIYGSWGLALYGPNAERTVTGTWPEKPEFMKVILLVGDADELVIDFLDESGLLWSDVIQQTMTISKIDGTTVKSSEFKQFGIDLDHCNIFKLFKKIKRVLFYLR